MLALKVILCVFPAIVLAEGNQQLTESCYAADLDCLGKSTEKFLGLTSQGIPKYDIRAIDPIIIPSFEFNPLPNVAGHLKDVNITGLKNQRIHDFGMNTEDKAVRLTTRADINIVSDITVQLKTKIYRTVQLRIKATSLGTANYNYTLKTDDKGVEHFEVGPETTTCELDGIPEMSISDPTLIDEIKKDQSTIEDVQKYMAQRTEFRKILVCQLVVEAYKSVIHNIRASAKLLPKTAFFKDI